MKDVALLLLVVVAISAAGSYLSGFIGAWIEDRRRKRFARAVAKFIAELPIRIYRRPE